MRIMFMGTPDFAKESLKALCERGTDDVVAVLTQPDKPKGRGYKLTVSPVKEYALEKNIPVFQPLTLKDEGFMTLLSQINPDLIVVAAYGKILPPPVLDFPKYGCINVHGSLLPKYRGAAPIQRAIIDGESVTGITTMYMAQGLDTGDMLLKTEVEISEDDNFQTLHDKLAVCGAETLLKTVEALKNGALHSEKQDDSKSTYAAKIEKSDCLIDFSKSCREIYNRIRGLSPMPLAFTHTPDGKILKIEACRILKEGTTAPAGAGTVISISDGIDVACRDGVIRLLYIRPEGKRCMSAQDYVRGRKIFAGDMFS